MHHPLSLPPAPRPLYPFAALAGQAQLKLALLLLAVDPALGGVLLLGEKGTAKSTAARGLAALLPPLAGSSRPTPFVELPLGATEDRVWGSLDLSEAVRRGKVRLSPGLLARAHGGILYVDEVNLLPAHLAGALLDAAASGVVRVEREGLSHSSEARFALVASGNPEEGEVGPQLTDRFGLAVEVKGEPAPRLRREILVRRLAFEADPVAFARRWEARQTQLRARVAAARARLAGVVVPPAALAQAAQAAATAHSQGSRGELTLIRAARALAAWQGAPAVGPRQLARVALLALGHRARPPAGAAPHPVPRLLAPLPPEPDDAPSPPPPAGPASETPGQGHQAGPDELALRLCTPQRVEPIATRLPAREGTSLKQAGRRAGRETPGARGRYLRASAQRLGRGLAFDATFRAAAPHQKARRRPDGPALVITEPDIREKVRVARRGRLVIFCVDASGSMHAAARMQSTKEAVLGLLTEAYQKRDRVGLVAFGGVRARVLLAPTGSVEVARRLLAELPTGGKTPLAAGLAEVSRVVAAELARDPKLSPLVVILTDGRPNVPLAASLDDQVNLERAGVKGGGWGDGWGDGGYADREVLNLAQAMARDPRARYVVVDTDTGHFQELNLCRALADYLGAACVSLGRVSTAQVLDLVKKNW
ncbi:MAG: VWA domain-containing protein [Deltaproteobacteria bacterium]|nr:VWA domain-containing protein [Deltaproteobacteria bacterium]